MPLFLDNNLLGFLILGEKTDRTFYTEEDINVFEILSRQAVLAIDHCIFMEEFSKKQEKVFQAEKLASIGGMADGIAHQMKNRLNYFSVASGEIKDETSSFVEEHTELVDKNPDLRSYFDYISEIGGAMVKNVRKANGILEGILTFARTEEKEAFFSFFSLREIIDTSLGLLLVKHRIGSGFPLEVEINSSDLIYGVKSQLLECVYNILDNCYEAIKEKMDFYLTEDERKNFTPCIKLSLIERVKSFHIDISDNGIGVKDEDKHKIFAPFFTTKPSAKSGTGIGLYIVKRIIEENHQGRISFRSIYMKGTRFLIDIPNKECPTKRDDSKEIKTGSDASQKNQKITTLSGMSKDKKE
ncbi:MAG: ATP-binding protein [bacterium]